MLPLHVAVTMLTPDDVDPDRGIKHFSDCTLTIFNPSGCDTEKVPVEQALHADKPGKTLHKRRSKELFIKSHTEEVKAKMAAILTLQNQDSIKNPACVNRGKHTSG